MANLAGKAVLITAAAQRIGRASVKAFVHAGAKVIEPISMPEICRSSGE